MDLCGWEEGVIVYDKGKTGQEGVGEEGGFLIKVEII